MSNTLAIWLLIAIVGALTVSSILFRRQQEAIVRGTQAQALARQIDELDPLIAFLDLIGASQVCKQTIHDLRQNIISRLIQLAPEDGWATQLSEQAPESPPRPNGPFTLKTTQQIPQVQNLLRNGNQFLRTRIKDPDVLAELNDLYALVAVDTWIHSAVTAANKNNFNEARAMLTRAKGHLSHPGLNGSIRLNREKQLQEAAMAMARHARQILEDDLRDGTQIEQAFMQMLDL